jgi:NAD+ diphosphatase
MCELAVVSFEPPLLDRAAALRTREDELAALLEDALVVPVWRGKCLLTRPTSDAPSRGALLEYRQFRELLGGERVFLGLRNGRGYFAVALPAADAPPTEIAALGDFNDLRLAGSLLEWREAELLAYARGILYWHGHHRHCAECGAPSQMRDGGHVRVCGACDTKHFPRTDPAIMALVTDGDRCVLARQAAWPPGMHSVLAGFVEPGESLEDAAQREVREEVGLEVEDIRYLRSQPWPFPSSLMVGFSMRAVTHEICLDPQELESARWFTRDELVLMRDARADGLFIPPPYSLAHQLIAVFIDG